MGSFFKNFLKPNNQNSENLAKKSTSKWMFLFKKTNEADQIISASRQEDNQGRLRNSNSASSFGSLTLSEQSMSGDNIILLPRLKKSDFTVPSHIPVDEWSKSQVYEVIHLTSTFVDLILSNNPTLSKNLNNELDLIVTLIEKQDTDFKSVFFQLFSVITLLHTEERNLWRLLKIEAHLNSLIAQLVELCSQLSEKMFLEISLALIAKGSTIDLMIYKQSLSASYFEND